ncbi:MAG: HD domain-containing protein [Oscillospiraceae bacterium]|nr:HD domain-containing protein [Oscillospiraceae bacterium]
MERSPMLALLRDGGWGEQQPWFDRLEGWSGYPLLLETLEQLNHEALYVSDIHGLGHIERTVLQGAFCAMEEGLAEEDTRLLLEACSYHDVGRVSDWYDELHGMRSAHVIGTLTGREGEALLILQAAVDAHSRKEEALLPTLGWYGVEESPKALCIAQLLKDADGLDRVRLGDLNPAYLRRESSKARVELAQAVFARYQRAIGKPAQPLLTEEIIAKLKELDAKRRREERGES